MPTLLKACLAALALTLAPAAAASQEASQTEEIRVMEAVNAFMTAFDNKDSATMNALLTEDAYLAWVREGEGGDPTQSMRLSDLATGIADVPADIAEPLSIRALMVDGPVAMVWADYAFYLDGVQTHCGVDIFTLMRVEGEWKIATITYSHIEQSCEDAPRP